MDDLISRQAAIDELNVSAELLKRALDDTDLVSAEREKFEWGLGLIESCISDIKDLPSAQPEIIRCKDCRYYQDNNDGYPHINCKWDANETPDADDFCSGAERRTDGRFNQQADGD